MNDLTCPSDLPPWVPHFPRWAGEPPRIVISLPVFGFLPTAFQPLVEPPDITLNLGMGERLPPLEKKCKPVLTNCSHFSVCEDDE